MKKLSLLLSTMILGALLVSACAGASEGTSVPEEGDFPEAGQETAVVTELPETGMEATPIITGTEVIEPATTITATVAVTGTQPAGTAVPSTPAVQLPATGGEIDTHRLSSLIGFSVVNQDGETLGTVRDFILNLCEAHILYIIVEPDFGLDFPEGETVLIPYEVVSVYDGQVNAGDSTIVVNMNVDQFQGAPSFVQTDLDMATVDWENEVVTYWSGVDFNMTLTSECRVEAPELGGQNQPTGTPGSSAQPTAPATVLPPAPPANQNTPAAPGADTTVVNKIAFASVVLYVQVMDGNNNLLGHVEEVLITPETGKLDFVAVRVDESLVPGDQLVLVPLRALNIPDPGAGQINLVLLVDTNILKNAPAFNELPDAFGEGWDADLFEYWSQHVQITREGNQ